MSEKKKTLKVTVDGKVFTRTTHRTYTHVLVGRRDKETARIATVVWTPSREESLQENFKHCQETADGSWWSKNIFQFHATNDTPIQNEGKRVVALGLDGYRAEVQARDEEQHAEAEARGDYQTKVISWHGSLRAAQAALTTARNRGYRTDLRIVEVPQE